MARYAINVGSSAGLDLVEENSLPRTPRPSPYPHVTGVSGPHPADLVEITSLQWKDIDFTRDRLAARASLVRVGGRLVRGPVKTAAGVRTLPLVALTRTALLAQRVNQAEQRAAAGTDGLESGYVFTTRSGRRVEPRNLSRSFDRIVAGAA